jgi:hypothetical protein
VLFVTGLPLLVCRSRRANLEVSKGKKRKNWGFGGSSGFWESSLLQGWGAGQVSGELDKPPVASGRILLRTPKPSPCRLSLRRLLCPGDRPDDGRAESPAGRACGGKRSQPCTAQQRLAARARRFGHEDKFDAQSGTIMGTILYCHLCRAVLIQQCLSVTHSVVSPDPGEDRMGSGVERVGFGWEQGVVVGRCRSGSNGALHT